MIWLTLATLRARWGQALTVALLASLAVAGAVAVPVYVDLARRIVVADDLAAATWSQRTLSTTDPVQLVAEPGNVAEEQLVEEARRRNFEHAAPAALSTPGFRTVFSVRYPITVDGGAADPGERGVLEFRQDFCAQVRITSGRCVLAAGEVLVSADLASRGLPVNATAAVTALRYVPGIPGDPGIWVPAGRPCRLAVVGVYRPIDAADPYWGRPSAALTAESSLRLLTSRRAVAACDHVQETQEAIAVPLPGTFAADRVDQVREAVEATIERAPGDIVVSSAVGALLSAIDRDRDLVSRVPTGAAVPFVALCWFVLFLAIAHTAAARRRELGAVKIRGVTARDQWWLAAAESLTPVLLGAAAGYLLGHAGVWAYGRVLFGVAATVPLSSRPWAYALVATLGAVIVSVLALRTDLAASVTDLLRRVPARGNRWAGVTLAVLVVAVAAVAVAQTRLQPGGPDGARGGLAPLAPALTLMALGLLSALVVDPLATRFGLRALRKGRVGLAVGALHLGRRGHGSRLLALVVVAVALLTFAAAAADLADGARHRQAELVVGADRVLTVTDVDPVGLLRTVRAVDPAGTYAMAVISVDAQPSGRKLMALDSTRLAAAARWPDADGQPGAPVGAAALRPATADPLVVRGRELALTLTATRLRLRTPGTAIELRLGLTPLTGAPARSYELGEVRLGQHTYSAAVDCPDGCRLSFIMIDFRGPVDGEFEFTLESVDQRGPDTPLATGAQLGRWWGPESGVLRTEPTGRGLGLSASSGLFDRDGLRLRPPDTPASLPVLDAGGSDPGTVLLGGDEQVATTVAARAALLPRLGPAGTVADLEYLTRLGEVFAASQAGEVWLGPAAPADAADRFRRAGLTVTGERGLADEVRAAQRRPSAVGTRFLLAVAVLSLILGASGLAVAAGVERGARAEELRWLRTQGLPRRQARRAVLASYLGVVVVAVVLGGLAAVVAWYLTGDRLPLSDTPTATMLIPDLPGVGAYLAWATGAAALGLVALLLSGALVRMIDTTAPSHRARRAR